METVGYGAEIRQWRGSGKSGTDGEALRCCKEGVTALAGLWGVVVP